MTRGATIAAAMSSLTLLSACGGGIVLKKGDLAPAFSTAADSRLQTADGAAVSLDGLRAGGPVMLVFLRGFS